MEIRTITNRIKQKKKIISTSFWFLLALVWIYYALNQEQGKLQNETPFMFIFAVFLYSSVLKSIAQGYIPGRLFTIKEEEIPEIFYLLNLIVFGFATFMLVIAIKEIIII